MANTVQIKRGNNTSVNAHTGPSGEIIYNLDTGRLHAQDGSTAGGNPHALISDVDLKANAAVNISAGTGLTGGGTLAASRTLALNSTSIASLAKADTAVQPAITITAGTGLTGGGTLAANRTVALNAASIASLGKADTAIQAPGGSTGQILAKNSATTNDVVWVSSEAATAVSYGPQSLTDPQKTQARANIGAFSSSGGTISGDTTVDGSLIAGASNVDIIRVGPEAGTNIVIRHDASIIVNNGAPTLTWPISIGGNSQSVQGLQFRAASAVVTTNVSGETTIPYPPFPSGAICAVASSGDLTSFSIDAQTTGVTNGSFHVRVTRTTDGSPVANSTLRINFIVIGS